MNKILLIILLILVSPCYAEEEEVLTVPVLKHSLKAGEIIAEDDIDFIKIPQHKIRKNTVTEAKELIGKTSKHGTVQGRPIRFEEIANPAIINKGNRITMIYKTPNIEIKTLGEAMEAGAKGDTIKVRNITSKQIIMGVVQSADKVRVISPDSGEEADGL